MGTYAAFRERIELHTQMLLQLLQAKKGQCVLHVRADRQGSNSNSSKERAKLNLREKTLLVRPAKY